MKSVSRKRLYLLSAHMQIKRLSETLCSVIWLAETIWNARNVVETQTLCHDFKTHPKRINGQEKRNRYCILILLLLLLLLLLLILLLYVFHWDVLQMRQTTLIRTELVFVIYSIRIKGEVSSEYSWFKLQVFFKLIVPRRFLCCRSFFVCVRVPVVSYVAYV